ncbi:cytochrome c oxidase subunit 1 [Coelomomyces lativittatus]|nr:cytochrome c oxidase subunit 1 [Coelomomyces lativittatus]
MVFAGWIASLKKIDFDEVFAYETLKTVIVRDRRLGFLHYFFMMVIFIYIVYSIISKQLYLIKDPIIRGAIRSTAYPPSTFATTYPYCRTTASTCLFLGANDVAQPEDGSIFVSTRVSITNATLQCPLHQLPTSPSCIPTFNKPDAQLFYVAGIENYTVRKCVGVVLW